MTDLVFRATLEKALAYYTHVHDRLYYKFDDGYAGHIFYLNLLINHIKRMLKSGDVNAKDNEGETLLSTASSYDNEYTTEITQGLLKNGADVNQKNNDGFTPLMSAVKSGNCLYKISILLKAGAFVDATNIGQESALHRACYAKNVAIAKLLIESGADVNLKASEGFTPLMIAVQENDKQLVSLLMSSGAHINESNSLGWTALMCAVQYFKDDVVKLLLDNGADVNKQNAKGDTPLLIAIASGQAQNVFFLMQKGTDINAKNEKGETPLFLARQERLANVEQWLVDTEKALRQQTKE